MPLFTANGAVNDFISGVGLSSANQMKDCGITFYDQDGAKNVYQIMSEQGGNLARIWVIPMEFNW